jgi:hypothetical protein
MGFLSCLGSIESAVLPTIGGLLGGVSAGGGAATSTAGDAGGASPYMEYLKQRVAEEPSPEAGVPLGQLLGEAGLGQSIDGLPGNLIGSFF